MLDEPRTRRRPRRGPRHRGHGRRGRRLPSGLDAAGAPLRPGRHGFVERCGGAGAARRGPRRQPRPGGVGDQSLRPHAGRHHCSLRPDLRPRGCPRPAARRPRADVDRRVGRGAGADLRGAARRPHAAGRRCGGRPDPRRDHPLREVHRRGARTRLRPTRGRRRCRELPRTAHRWAGRGGLGLACRDGAADPRCAGRAVPVAGPADRRQWRPSRRRRRDPRRPHRRGHGPPGAVALRGPGGGGHRRRAARARRAGRALDRTPPPGRLPARRGDPQRDRRAERRRGLGRPRVVVRDAHRAARRAAGRGVAGVAGRPGDGAQRRRRPARAAGHRADAHPHRTEPGPRRLGPRGVRCPPGRHRRRLLGERGRAGRRHHPGDLRLRSRPARPQRRRGRRRAPRRTRGGAGRLDAALPHRWQRRLRRGAGISGPLGMPVALLVLAGLPLLGLVVLAPTLRAQPITD